MKTIPRSGLVFSIFLAVMLTVSSACDAATVTSTPLPEEPEATTPSSEPAAPTDSPAGANLVITDVTLDTTTPTAGDWVLASVTIENQGDETASGYELVLIPHYGYGPPNPAGYETLPDLAPGASHTVDFTPGVLYPDEGTFTLRVLVTDDWYDIGEPDSTGTAGDFVDITITVSPAPVANMVITNVDVSTATPTVGGWVIANVTIENQGDTTASGYELVLIPHYGWGPPNPAGYETIPDLAPGDSHNVIFNPGAQYPDEGYSTMRVLLTDDWYNTGNPDSTGTAGDFEDILINVGPAPVLEANMVITNVTLSTTTPAAGGWVVPTITIKNKGDATASGYELVLIPHYGWGPPNPAGYEPLSDMAPGASQTITFSPGVLYTDSGTFTLRVLLTDDWYATGNPDSTGTAGDHRDITITVGGG
ncbi:MAG: hypothetical protein JXA25_12705 [Anaerolineales bacterium]|nr:hypothetical protein [Anaerolineales bacterium]